jgi:hypothetical protein
VQSSARTAIAARDASTRPIVDDGLHIAFRRSAFRFSATGERR